MGLKRKASTEPIKLGEKYRDTITGFVGVATSRIEYLYGCVRVCLEREAPDTKPEEREQFFDEQRLVTLASAKPLATATSGGPQRTPPARSTDRR